MDAGSVTNRCEDTGMLADQCAGRCCRPDLDRRDRERGDRVPAGLIVARFAARFDSDCDHCSGRMFEGDPICRTAAGYYIHEDCSEPWPDLANVTWQLDG